MTSPVIVLEGIAWETYAQLLADTGPERGKLFTYDGGTLQIAIPSLRQERPNRLLASIVGTVTEEWSLDVHDCGSMTVLCVDRRKGFEPDSCFYIRNAAAVRGKVDITRDSLNKFPIFAAVGVPEVWRYNENQVAIHVLCEGGYVEAPVSDMLAPLSGEVITPFLMAGLDEDRPQWIKRLREWARAATRS